jgi:hypothetical protein
MNTISKDVLQEFIFDLSGERIKATKPVLIERLRKLLTEEGYTGYKNEMSIRMWILKWKKEKVPIIEEDIEEPEEPEDEDDFNNFPEFLPTLDNRNEILVEDDIYEDFYDASTDYEINDRINKWKDEAEKTNETFKKTKEFNQQFESFNNALNNMKDGLEDEEIDEDIDKDKNDFIKTKLELQLTDSYILIVHETSLCNKENFLKEISKPINLKYKEMYDYSIAKDSHTVYNTYRFTTKSIQQIQEQVYHIWWDHDKENRK